MIQKSQKSQSSPNSKVASKQDTAPKHQADLPLLNRIAQRALYYSTQVIHQANNRDDIQKGDPKIGGHPAACASLTHVLGALHLMVREPQDHIANKPHGSPMDHAYHHLLHMFYHEDGSRFTDDQAKKVMFNLRKFSDPDKPGHEPVFQSYHATWDPDSMNYFPSGTVGIPPVASAYMALAYRFAKDHDFEVPADAHFWSIMGDSEFREGSLHECMPDVAERHLNNVTWIVDYNRQNLDGARIKNEDLTGNDCDRIERLAKANGWSVHNVRHGSKRLEFFNRTGGDLLRKIFEKHLTDYEFQSLLMAKDGKIARTRFIELEPGLEKVLVKMSDTEVRELLEDLGGHDLKIMYEVLKKCRASTDRPCLVIAHTIKGWGLDMAATQGCHSALPEDKEVDALREREGIAATDLFQNFDPKSPEGRFLSTRGDYFTEGFQAQRALKERNITTALKRIEGVGGIPDRFGIDLKLVPWGNTQWMWGQLAAKLIRIANVNPQAENASEKKQTLTEADARWKPVADYVVTMAPDVGTSTNLNPSMDDKIYGPTVPDYEERYHVKDARRPYLMPLERESNRHLRFEIEEANSMTCAGSFGKMKDILGIPFLPLMSIYDFFIKRAHDQFFYNIYWRSGFICIGTPSGVSLSPEGAQHSWKSDFQIPNLITWEPAFAAEMDWILADTVRRHFTNDNLNRQSVLLRAVTMGIEQKLFIENLRKQVRFQGMSDADILEQTRQHVLEGGYWLVNYQGSEGYHPGDNVVHIVAMGTLVPEAVKASQALLEKGIYANVLVVTSPELLCGALGKLNGFHHLRQTLGINGNMHLNPSTTVVFGGDNKNSSAPLVIQNGVELLSLRGSRVPVVSSHDGEPGLLDNIGAIIGVPHESLAVRKHSKSGRPVDVFAYHHIDATAIAQASQDVLVQAASEEILVDPRALSALQSTQATATYGSDENYRNSLQ